MEKPVILFCGFTYYPAPGWQGFFGRFYSLEEASLKGKGFKETDAYDWWQVVDLRDDKIVGGEGCGHTGLYGLFAANPVGTIV